MALTPIVMLAVVVVSLLSTWPSTAQSKLIEIAEAARLTDVATVSAAEISFTRSDIRSLRP